MKECSLVKAGVSLLIPPVMYDLGATPCNSFLAITGANVQTTQQKSWEIDTVHKAGVIMVAFGFSMH